MSRRAQALTGLLLSLTAGCALGPLEAAEPSEVERGAALFRDREVSAYPFNVYTCATCHDATAPEDDVLRPGAPMAGVTARSSYWGGKEIDLLRAVNHCLRFFMLQDEPWTGTEPEARAIYAYLASLPPGPGDVPFTVPIDIADVPDGRSDRGAEVYDRACAACHGAPHTGEDRLVLFASVLPDDVLTVHPFEEFTPAEIRLVVIEKLRHGGFAGYDGQMPPFSKEKISDEEVGDLLAFFGL